MKKSERIKLKIEALKKIKSIKDSSQEKGIVLAPIEEIKGTVEIAKKELEILLSEELKELSAGNENKFLKKEDFLLSKFSTDDVKEGKNKYFKDSFLKGLATEEYVSDRIYKLSTSDIEEGKNLYFTEERVKKIFFDEQKNIEKFSLGEFTTSDLKEGENLYFTEDRVKEIIPKTLKAGSGIKIEVDNDGITIITANIPNPFYIGGGSGVNSEYVINYVSSVLNNYLYKPGIAGGQTVYGGTASGNDFTLYSNNLKDGKIKFGDTAYLNEATAKFFGNGYIAYSEAFTAGYASYDQGFAIKKDWVTTGTYPGGAHKAGAHIEVTLDDGGSYYDTVAGVWVDVNYNGTGGSTGASYAGWFRNQNSDSAGDSIGIYAEGYSGGLVALVSGYGAALSGYDYAPSGGVAIQGYSTSSLGRGIEGIASGDNSKAIHAQGISNHSGSYGLYVDFQYTVSAANKKSHIEGILDVGTLKILEGTGGTYYTTFQGGDQAADITYTLPTAAPAVSGYALTATTAGVMSWAPAGASAGGSDTQVQFNDGGTSLGGDSGATYNKTTHVLTISGGLIVGTQPDYTFSNVTTNRTLDADSTTSTIADILDILGTYGVDLQTIKLFQ